MLRYLACERLLLVINYSWTLKQQKGLLALANSIVHFYNSTFDPSALYLPEVALSCPLPFLYSSAKEKWSLLKKKKK